VVKKRKTAKRAPSKIKKIKKHAAKKTAKSKAKKALASKKVSSPKRPPKSAGPKRPEGLPEILKKAALKVLDERQAENVVTADLRGRSAMADYAMIASGRSGRQVAALADHLQKAFEKLGARKIRVEGLPQGDWVLIDAGDVIVHLFRPEVRRYYSIEDIWSHKSRGA